MGRRGSLCRRLRGWWGRCILGRRGMWRRGMWRRGLGGKPSNSKASPNTTAKKCSPASSAPCTRTWMRCLKNRSWSRRTRMGGVIRRWLGSFGRDFVSGRSLFLWICFMGSISRGCVVRSVTMCRIPTTHLTCSQCRYQRRQKQTPWQRLWPFQSLIIPIS